MSVLSKLTELTKGQLRWLQLFILSLAVTGFLIKLAEFRFAFVHEAQLIVSPSPTPPPMWPTPSATPSLSGTLPPSPLPSETVPTVNATPSETSTPADIVKISGEEKNLFLWRFLSVLSTVAAFGGFIGATIISWRRDKREKSVEELDRELKQTQLKKAQLELKELEDRLSAKRKEDASDFTDD